ncbi:outer membrane protein assembly factor BamE [Paucibacter sp. XJ19-41]|uniref:outer membrane protein assembly factor BamE n=1 Tax=Paucibacter sp. XJ19-41 TaxID=2927824 RepID=UPI00234A7315|nr:outer membrane protein assembly factor BamE [Paucibacter sp. XJ19-41]MDC6170478.1 outer membrane protein assembly factor BamE [Paucibacter sp. XJ19-41]
MPRHSSLTLWLTALLVALAGCATLERDARLQPGISTADQVQAFYGRPVQVWQDADGGRTLEYSSQPFGNTCFMVKLDAAGKLVGVRDTLLEASRFSITPGMSEEQVSRLLGRERTRVFFRFSGEDVWDWNVQPEQGGYLLRFNVHFKNGRVLRLSQSTVFPSDRFPDLD